MNKRNILAVVVGIITFLIMVTIINELVNGSDSTIAGFLPLTIGLLFGMGIHRLISGKRSDSFTLKK